MNPHCSKFLLTASLPWLVWLAMPAAQAAGQDRPLAPPTAAPSPAAASAAHPPDAAATQRQLVALGELPLSFVASCSATRQQNEFYARRLGYAIKLAPDATHIGVLRNRMAAADPTNPPRRAVDVVSLRLLGANRDADGRGANPLPGAVNYFRADHAAGDCANQSSFERVRFSAVYPGIDLVYYGNDGELEFDLVVAPGADPESIRLAIDNADRISIDPQGDLRIDAGGEMLSLRHPVAYQERGGAREPVMAAFALDDRGHVSFQVAAYDRGRALTIDPVLSYATYLGGTKTDNGTAVAVDASGNIYVAGYTTSTDFPVSSSAYDKTLGASDVDAFVTKLGASGNTLAYSTYLGGTGIDRAVAIAIDTAGNAYVTGTTTGGFPTTAGAYQSAPTGSDSFVAKLGTTGSTLAYSTYVQGVEARGIAVDAAGSAYVTGRVATTFTTTAGAYQQTPGGAFVLKLNPAGTAATYATYLGHGGNESANAIVVDAPGNAYVAGSTDSASFPTVNALQGAKGGGKDGFIAKLNPAGTALIYSTYLGGGLDDAVNALAVDAAGNAYVAGETYSPDFPVQNAFMAQKPGTRLANASLGSAFFAKVSATGDALLYSSFMGGEICTAACNIASPPAQYPGDAAYGIAVDQAGHAFISGLARSYTFPLVNSLKSAKTLDNQDSAFVVKATLGGGSLLYSTLIRTGTSEAPNAFTRFPPGAATGIAADSAGAAYVTGDADSASNFTTVNAYQTTNGGNQGAIVAKISGATGTLTLAASAFAVVTPNPVTLTATIAGATLSGNIVFMDGSATVGTVAISSSKAVLTTTLPVGIHRLSAIYPTTGKEIDSPVVNVVVDNVAVCN